jgi:crossover junction endodeoxyribonuclease RusA
VTLDTFSATSANGTAPFSVFVRGIPAPQGSKRAFVQKGRAIVVDDNPKTLKDWRAAVASVLQNQWAGPPIDGAVSVELYFSLLRPKSAPKSRIWHTTRPDVDKLARALLDAMTGIVFRDDSQVTDLVVQKRYWQESGVRVIVQEARQL